MEMHTVKWADTRLNGRLWASRSDDDRWYIEHLDMPGTPWGVYYCEPGGDIICEAALLPTLTEAKRCVESGRIVNLVIHTLEQRVTHAARMLAASTDAERRSSDHHENARSLLAGAVADLLMPEPAE